MHELSDLSWVVLAWCLWWHMCCLREFNPHGYLRKVLCELASVSYFPDIESEFLRERGEKRVVVFAAREEKKGRRWLLVFGSCMQEGRFEKCSSIIIEVPRREMATGTCRRSNRRLCCSWFWGEKEFWVKFLPSQPLHALISLGFLCVGSWLAFGVEYNSWVLHVKLDRSSSEEDRRRRYWVIVFDGLLFGIKVYAPHSYLQLISSRDICLHAWFGYLA